MTLTPTTIQRPTSLSSLTRPQRLERLHSLTGRIRQRQMSQQTRQRKPVLPQLSHSRMNTRLTSRPRDGHPIHLKCNLEFINLIKRPSNLRKQLDFAIRQLKFLDRARFKVTSPGHDAHPDSA
jgi:hypothetical protein